MGICYLCGNEIGLFTIRSYNIDELLTTKGQIPSGMTKSERVCYTCFKSMEKRKKTKSTQSNDDTQFWVCPVCNNDIKEYHGKSYCHNCKRWL